MTTANLDLALELRPQSLDEVIGQDEISLGIFNFMERGQRCWLFSGPTGVGKTTLARIVAREIQGFDFPSDLKPDILEINCASETGKDNIRELAQMADYLPLFGKYKVIILDECHRLSDPAKISLLKELEKDATTTVWILCTTEPSTLPKPLRDRCSASFNLKEMGKRERRELVTRAAAHLDYKDDLTAFLDALETADIKSAREVYGAFYKFYLGVPARMALGLE